MSRANLLTGCVIASRPSDTIDLADLSSLIAFCYPADFTPPPQALNFVFPELPDVCDFETFFVVTFATPAGVLFGHTLRTTSHTVCLFSNFCCDALFRPMLRQTSDIYATHPLHLEDYLQQHVASPPPDTLAQTPVDIPPSVLVEKLSVSQIVILCSALIAERHIIVVGSHYDSLTSFVSALINLLHPLSYPHTLVTLLPHAFRDIVELPTPYIIGMSAELFATFAGFTNKVLIVNLDTGAVQSNDTKMINDDVNLIPPKALDTLKISLQSAQTEPPDVLKTLISGYFQNFVMQLIQDPVRFLVHGKKGWSFDHRRYVKAYVKKTNAKNVANGPHRSHAVHQFFHSHRRV